MPDTVVPDAIAQRLALAIQAGDAAGANAMRHYQDPALEVTTKPDDSPVTNADKQGETIIRDAILRAFPRDGVLGEEFPQTPGTSGFRWIIDPIDGTRAFTRGLPTFGVLIGIEQELNGAGGRIVAGYAGFPAMSEAVWGAAGAGAHWRSTQGTVPARVSRTPTLSSATADSLWPHYYHRNGKAAIFDALARDTARLRTWSDAFSFALVATGRIDAAVNFGCSLWDIAPFVVITREAGGLFTDWQGGVAESARTHLASNGALHPELLTLVQNHG